jgi:biotin carboxylase
MRGCGGDAVNAGDRILVVGATADYIEILRREQPGSCLFLTSESERRKAFEDPPAPEEECLFPPDAGAGGMIPALEDHLARRRMTLAGIVCYDCEFMSAAAVLGGHFRMPYPSPETIANCRDKRRCKEIWSASGIPCPRSATFSTPGEAAAFFRSSGGPVVLKPLTGSGGEWVFRCDTEKDCGEKAGLILDNIGRYGDRRMYRDETGAAAGSGAPVRAAAEEHVSGTEYSCDLLVDGADTRMIRLARKIPAPGRSFGATLAYELPGALPEALTPSELTGILGKAAAALGIERAICMVDFILRDGTPLLIEMTPRPGGDCLPFLIRQSSGFDILQASLDLALGRTVRIPEATRWEHLLGLRLFADRPGIVAALDIRLLERDPRVREVCVNRRPGHRVVLPPDDYDSRVVGHAVFAPEHMRDAETECSDLSKLLRIEWEAT